MSANAPKPNEMLPIDNDDHTLEIDTRWLLTDRPELKAHMESVDAATDTEASAAYEDPRLGAALTATQVIELLNLGKR